MRKTATRKPNVTFIAFPLSERQRVLEFPVPGSGSLKPVLEAQIAQGVPLLDLMLEYFSADGHGARGRYDDGNGLAHFNDTCCGDVAELRGSEDNALACHWQLGPALTDLCGPRDKPLLN